MLRAENICYTYQPGTPFEYKALHDVTCEIPNGSVTAIIGSTGSGKSTLLQMFNALIKPTSGRILIDDKDITSNNTDLKNIHFTVGLVFQYPEYQLFEETVYKDIAFGPRNMGLSDDEIQRRVMKAMSLTGLDERYADKSPFELSGGQKRRAAIAGVLAMEPKILMLDEPAAGLDPRGRKKIFETIKTMHEGDPNMIIIFVSHSMEEVAEACDNVIVMNNGSIAMSGGVQDIFMRSKELVNIGLNVPQITMLADKLRILGYKIPENIYTVQGAVDALRKMLKG